MKRFVIIVNVFQNSEYVSDYDSMCYIDKRFKDRKDVLSLHCSNSDIWLTPETRLHHDLIQSNTKRLLMFPLLKGTFALLKGTLLVKIELILIQVIDIEEANEILVINAWMRQANSIYLLFSI